MPDEKPRYWYRITIYECPICGHSFEYRERMYTPKPVDRSERVEELVDTTCAISHLM